MQIADIITRIRAYRDAQRWSNHRLATEAGLSGNALQHLDKDDFGCHSSTLDKVLAIIPADFQIERAA